MKKKKQLLLKSTQLRAYQKGIPVWLTALGYAPSSIGCLLSCIAEFMHYIEKQGHSDTTSLTQADIIDYLDHISTRRVYVPKSGYGPALSQSSINMQINGLKKLSTYLRHYQHHMLPLPTLLHEPAEPLPIKPLTVKQMKSLYAITYRYEHIQRAFSLRDRAILALLYDCGLRRSEAIHLKTSEVTLASGQLYVYEGKGAKSRIVPFSAQTKDYLQDYLLEGRPALSHAKSTDHFILNRMGNQSSGVLLSTRLKVINAALEDPLAQINPHLLRHSIATHLLASGMALEEISRFLGHSSLDVTERYTHLAKQLC